MDKQRFICFNFHRSYAFVSFHLSRFYFDVCVCVCVCVCVIFVQSSMRLIRVLLSSKRPQPCGNDSSSKTQPKREGEGEKRTTKKKMQTKVKFRDEIDFHLHSEKITRLLKITRLIELQRMTTLFARLSFVSPI